MYHFIIFCGQELNTFNLDLLCLGSHQAKIKLTISSAKSSSRKRPPSWLLQSAGRINFLVVIEGPVVLLGVDQAWLLAPACCSRVLVLCSLLSQHQRSSLSHIKSLWLSLCDHIFLLLKQRWGLNSPFWLSILIRIGWYPPTAGRAIYFNKSTDSNVSNFNASHAQLEIMFNLNTLWLSQVDPRINHYKLLFLRLIVPCTIT